MANGNQLAISMLRQPNRQVVNSQLLRPPTAISQAGNSPLFLVGSNTRPLWFDGRFLAAGDLQREQNYFLARQAYLGQAAGSGVLHGLTVDQAGGTQSSTTDTIVIRAGDGIAPSGELVMIANDLTIQLSDLPDEENLDEQFGLAEMPQQPARTRTGVYVLALRPVQFTANPIASYPASLQSPRMVQDGDIVEATAVSLVPFPTPVKNFDPALQRAVLARQIFLQGTKLPLPGSLLPLAMVSLDRNQIQWIDMYLVRRDSGPQSSAARLGLADPATQQAFLMQYDAQLKTAVSGVPANTPIAATDYFQALPPAGPLTIASINTSQLTQVFFPAGTNVTLTAVPSDELPAVLHDSLSLPPIDLTLSAGSYTNLDIVVMVPVARDQFATVRSQVTDAQLTSPSPVPIFRPLLAMLQSRSLAGASPPPPPGWPSITAGLKYAFYARARNQPVYVPVPAAP